MDVVGIGRKLVECLPAAVCQVEVLWSPRLARHVGLVVTAREAAHLDISDLQRNDLRQAPSEPVVALGQAIADPGVGKRKVKKPVKAWPKECKGETSAAGLAAWMSTAPELPAGRAAVTVAATGTREELLAARILLLDVAAGCGVLAAEHRTMAARLRMDLVFPRAAAAAGYCTKIEQLHLAAPGPVQHARVTVGDLGHHLLPLIQEQELLRIAATAVCTNPFASPLLVDCTGPLVEAKFLSVIDVNLFLQFLGWEVEERSLGSLRSCGEAAGRRWALHPAPGSRRFRVRVDSVPSDGRSLAKYEVVLARSGPTHLMFRSKLQVFQFLFSGTARAMDTVHLELEDVTEYEAEKEEGEGVRVRVSRELAQSDPGIRLGLSPLPQLVPLTPGGLLPVAALEQGVTAGLKVSAVRYRRPGVRSSEWRSCVREGGLILPPRPGGWDAAADIVVFVEGREQGKVVVDKEVKNSSVTTLKLPSASTSPDPTPSQTLISPTSTDPTGFTFVTIRPKLRRVASIN